MPDIPRRDNRSGHDLELPKQSATTAQHHGSRVELPQSAARSAHGSQPAFDVPAPSVPGGPGRTPEYVNGRGEQSHRRPSTRLMIAAGITVAVAVCAVTYATTQSDPPRAGGRVAAASPSAGAAGTSPKANSTVPLMPNPSSTGTALAGERAAANWVSANLTRVTPILAQGALSARLKAQGFSAIGADTSKPAYVLGNTKSLRTQVGDSLYSRSVPVAQFGTVNSVQVRSVLTVPADRVQTVLASDRSNRGLAGTALASNPQLSASAGIRAVVRSGGLDLRAATFLALVASDVQVRLAAVPSDVAESTLSRPRRVLVINASGAAAAAIRDAARALPTDYAPAHIGSTGSGSIELTWSPSAQSVSAVT